LTAAGSARLRSGPEGPRLNTSVAASRWLQIAPSESIVGRGSQRAARLRHAGPGAAAESKNVSRTD